MTENGKVMSNLKLHKILKNGNPFLQKMVIIILFTETIGRAELTHTHTHNANV